MSLTDNNLTLLVIDDEASILLILERFFKDSFIVVTKSNAIDGLNWMQEGNIPSIIISDLEMPVMNGYELIDQVRASGFLQHIPMIMLSGTNNSESRIRCLEAGADDYVVKPFNPRELAARVNGILRRIGKK